MKEKIILAPGISSSELLRTLAKNGVNTIGLRVMSSIELARFVLMKAGVSVTEEFLTRAEEPSVIYSFLNEIPYFKTASYADAENMANTLNTIRMPIPETEEDRVWTTGTDKYSRLYDSAFLGHDIDDELFMMADILRRGEFQDKNYALFVAYRRYMQECVSAGKIDSVKLIRDAVVFGFALDDQYDFFSIKEYPIQSLEKCLIDKISDGNYKEISISELLDLEPKNIEEISITEGYGEVNEVESILSDIYSRELPLDKCVIACAGSSYSQLFYDMSKKNDIPMTFGSGVPIGNSNPARLLKLMYEWNTNGYNGIDALRNLLNSEAIDRKLLLKKIAGTEELKRRELEEIIKAAGSLRISMDAEKNKVRIQNLVKIKGEIELIKQVQNLAAELELGMADFIDEYALVRPEPAGRIDQSAVNVITSTMKAYEQYADGDINELIPELLAKTVCSENSREGALHITSIQSAIPCMRENLYVCGLSAANFPGSPSENYLMLDNDFRCLSDTDYEELPTSENRVKNRKKQLENLLGFAATLGVNTKLSYSAYSLSELKVQNPSSVLFGFAESINPDITMDEFRKSIVKAPYFSSSIDANRLVGSEYSLGSEIDYEKYEAEKLSAEEALNRAWSPSALDIFYQCPRHFYLQRIMRIPEDEPDDPFMVLSAADIGTIAHSMMEELATHDMDKEAFLDAAGEAFDEALVARPPMHVADAKQQRKEFLKMMASGYDADPHNAVLSAETEYRYEHPTGIELHGYPDRVETTADGRNIIADFKTKRKIEHVQDDFNTCLQVIVYAWMCEQAGIDISSCEYRYLRKGRSVSCVYDDTKRGELDEFLRYFKQCIENNDFPRNENEVSCKYCKMADICKWSGDE